MNVSRVSLLLFVLTLLCAGIPATAALTTDTVAHQPRVLARPDSGVDTEDAFTAPDTARHHYDTTHFRLHWTSTTEDAAAVRFVKNAAVVLEHVWDVEVDRLGWPRPQVDGKQGGNELVDVYLVDLGQDAYGYVAADDSSLCSRCVGAAGYLVLDNDYEGFLPDPDGAFRAAAAHEFNHLLQFGMAYHAEGWAYEATAVWMERVVFPGVDARTQYLVDFSDSPEVPLTDFGSTGGGFEKAYGSYVWNLWLEHRYGRSLVLDAWNASAAHDSHLIRGYADVLAGRGVLLEQEFVAFMAATAAWDHGGFPREVAAYPPVRREAELVAGQTRSVELDHTSAYLADIPLGGRPDADLTVTVRGPRFVSGGIALVATSGSEVFITIDDTLYDGKATVSIPAGTGIGVATLVVVNADFTLAVPKSPQSDSPRYLFDQVSYRIGVDVEAPRLSKQ